MITPVGQRSTQRAQRVHTSSSITKTTLSSGSTPGSAVFTASATVSGVSMWMHFHGQMSTQPSHMMHSDWSMLRNCLGLTDFPSWSVPISARTYSPGKDGMGGLASVLAMSGPPHERAPERRRLDRRRRLLRATALLEDGPQRDVHAEHDHVDDRDDDVPHRLLGDQHAAVTAEEREPLLEE